MTYHTMRTSHSILTDGEKMEQYEQAVQAIEHCMLQFETVHICPPVLLAVVRLADGESVVYQHRHTASDKPQIQRLSPPDFLKQYPLFDAVLPQGGLKNTLLFAPSFWASAVAQKKVNIPPVLDDMVQIIGPKAFVCARQDQQKIVKTLKRQTACIVNAKTIADSGILAAAATFDRAFTAVLVLEKAAQVFLQGSLLGGAVSISKLDAVVMHWGYLMGYSKKAASVVHQTATEFRREIPAKELELRSKIVELGQQLTNDNLVQGTWGNISVRLDKEHFLCTPSGLTYNSITPYDIVRVELGTLEWEGRLKPTAEKNLHAALLNQHKDVQCIIHAHPVLCSVFAATRRDMNVKGWPEEQLLGASVPVAAYGFPTSKSLCKNTAAAIQENCACLLANHGMVACGQSMADAYEKAMAMERAAGALLQAVADGEKG